MPEPRVFASAALFAIFGVMIALADEKTAISLATATPGGGFPVYGDAVAAMINGRDPTIDIKTRNTAGSAENIPLLEKGEADLALVQGESAYEALNGIGRPPANLRIFSAMYGTAGMFIVRADSPYRKIEDLKGKPIAFGAKGSGLVVLARYILDGLGLDRDRDFQAIFLDKAGDGPKLLAEGKVAALWGGGIGWPGFTAVANSEAGGRFIVPDPESLQRIQQKHPFLKQITLPAGSYRGQDAQLVSLGSWSFILARPALPDDVAYRLAKALHESEAELAKRLPQGRETTAANTLAAAPRLDLVHPGVQNYFRDIGLLPK